MKKIFTVFLTVLILLTTIFITPVFAKNNVELKLSDVKVYAGDEFEIKLFISDNSQLGGAVIDLAYDETMLEYVSSEKGKIIDENAMVSIKPLSNSTVRFTYLSPNSAVTSNGILFTVKFKALENAAGESDIKITIPSAGDFVDSNAEKLAYSIQDATVKIINTTTEKVVPTESTTVETLTNELETTIIPEVSTNNSNNIDNTNSDNVNIKIVTSLFVAGFAIVLSVIVYLIYNKKNKR